MVIPDPAGVWAQHGAEHAHQGRLSRAVGAKQAIYARGQRVAQIIDRFLVFEAAAQVRYPQLIWQSP